MTTGTPAPTAFVVDDDEAVRDALALHLDLAGITARCCASAAEFLAAASPDQPGCAILDIRMPGMDGLSATAALRARPGAPEVLVLTTFDTGEQVRKALRAGASGFLLKHTPPAELARAVRRAAAGEPMFSPSVLRQVMSFAAEFDEDADRDRARAQLGKLSRSERDVARLIADGLTNQEIGAELRLSTATVKAYITRIFTKLDLVNRVQVAILVHDAR